MNSDVNILGSLTKQDKLLVSRLDDMMYISSNKYINKSTLFLDERQCQIAEVYLESKAFKCYTFFGGYNSARRKVLMVFCEYNVPEVNDIPVICIEITYRKQDKLSHRDFLGSLMALNITRESIGDIVVSEGRTYIFVYNTVADVVMNELVKVGKVGVKLKITSEPHIVSSDSFKMMTGSVASLRLDCLTSFVTGLSREKTALFIKSTGVDINYVNVRNISHIMSENDVFSIRGYGKFTFDSVNGESKKGRTHICVKKFI